jgi:hypothetical protein
MSIQQMQQQLIQQINTINDEDILRMLGEELSYSVQGKQDLKSILSEEDFADLSQIADEPVGKDSISFQEFNSIMDKWLTK